MPPCPPASVKFSAALFALGLALSAPAQEAKPVLPLKTEADCLALHVSGVAPMGTTKLELRFAEAGAIANDAAW